MCKLIGYSMIASPFVFIAAVAIYTMGILFTLMMFGAAVVIVGLVAGGTAILEKC